jgi:Fic-DOC domain mobile mystery protein B
VVTDFLFKDRDGQTPLPPDLQKGLKLKHIQNIGELDEFEEKNISEGLVWLKKNNENYRKYNFWKKLHKKLFGNVWAWAGKIRDNELANTYFLLPYQIHPAFKTLEGDLEYWLKNREIPFNEIAARFHERIETIHPFQNGNGRFGRILIEHFCLKENQIVPKWGISIKDNPKLRRDKYIDALDSARRTKNYDGLIKFMFDRG